jgi:hypothetical protein
LDFEFSEDQEHVPDTVAADVLVLTATTNDGERGAFVVERDWPGVEVVAAPTVDGTRKFAALTLPDTPAVRLGGAGDSTSAVAETADRIVVAAVVDGVGAASRALDMAVDYAKERRQFERPVGSFEASSTSASTCCARSSSPAPVRTTRAGRRTPPIQPNGTAPPPWRRRSRPTSSTAWARRSSRSTAGSGSPGSTTRTCTTSGSSR